MRTFFGRRRHDVPETLDWVTEEIVAGANDTYVNAETFVEPLVKGSKAYEGREVTMVLDNARCQKRKLVKGKAKRLGIELLYLPFYSQKQINGEIGIAISVKVF